MNGEWRRLGKKAEGTALNRRVVNFWMQLARLHNAINQKIALKFLITYFKVF